MPFLHPCPVDSIEANVENAEVHVERGTDQLQRAAYYQVGVLLSLKCSILGKIQTKNLHNRFLSVFSFTAKVT